MTGLVPAASTGTNEILRSRLVLHLAVEASLEKSRKALLALDLGGLATQTREQILLSRCLAALNEWSGVNGGTQQLARDEGCLVSAQTVEQVRASALRVQSAIRLQLAILSRLRHKLRVMANMLAETGAPYGPAASARLRGYRLR